MTIAQGATNTFKVGLLDGGYDFATGNFKIALFTGAADIGPETTAYYVLPVFSERDVDCGPDNSRRFDL
jgi:hypothetical protein